jgi:hypothetical protein
MAVGERIGMLKQRRKAHGLRNPARAGSAKLRLPPIQASETLALPFRKIESLSLCLPSSLPLCRLCPACPKLILILDLLGIRTITSNSPLQLEVAAACPYGALRCRSLSLDRWNPIQTDLSCRILGDCPLVERNRMLRACP